MAKRKITAPYLKINGSLEAPFADSIEVDDGLASVVVEALTTGAGGAETVHGEDISTCIGEVMCKFPATSEMMEKARQWKANTAGNTIEFYEVGLLRTMYGASSTEPQRVAFTSSEGGFTVTFKGDPMSK